MEHGRPMQGHCVEALVEMSRDIQRGVLGQECYAGGLASVTWGLEDGTLQMMKRTSWT